MFGSPINEARAQRVISMLGLNEKSQVIDVGCGNGEILTRVVSAYKCRGVGIDPDGAALSQARSLMFSRGLDSERLQYVETTAEDFDWASYQPSCILCIGSVQAFDTFDNALNELGKRVRERGLIVMGDVFWRATPSPDYRERLGDGFPEDSVTFSHLARLGAKHGLVNLYATSSTVDEWDDFEGGFSARILGEVLATPDGGEERESQLVEALQWREGYLRWGRSTMGFGLFVYQKPSTEDRKKVREILGA